MSLIADALRKAGEPKPATLESPTPKSRWPYSLLALGIAGILVVFAVNHSRPSPERTAASRESTTEPALSSQAKNTGLNLLRLAEGQWRLNGTVRGGNGESLALINGQVVEEGASIQGAKVVRVAQDQVDIEDGSGAVKTLKLR